MLKTSNRPLYKTSWPTICLLIILITSQILLPISLRATNHVEIDTILYVDDDNRRGPWDGSLQYPFQHIQEAVDAAYQQQHIYVFNGTYHEQIIINKQINIIGECTTKVLIDGGYSPYIIIVESSGSVIRNLTIQHSGAHLKNAGIVLNGHSNHIINCEFLRTKTGILINEVDGTYISNCLFYQNGEGIFVNKATNSYILDSFFIHNGIGINGFHSQDITIINCSATINGIGIFFDTVKTALVERCALFNNNDNQGGLFLTDCNDLFMNNSHIYHNGFGVKTDNCHEISVANSTFQFNTHFGLYISDQTTSLYVNHCEFISNLRFSIHIDDSDITVHHSNLYESIMGLYSRNSTCNVEENYWGSAFGPAVLDRAHNDRIYSRQSQLSCIPWLSAKEQHAGANWKLDTFTPDITFQFQPEITFDDIDTDGDGVPDWWEEQYGYDPYTWDDHNILDPDNDGLNNIQECYAYVWGADPFKKDVFWEMDWMESKTHPAYSNKPSEALLSEIIDSFALHGITLHIDTGEFGGGEIIPYRYGFSYADLRDYYWDYFLHNDMNNPRKGIFHYGLICDVGPGSGFAFIGWDSLDGFCISADLIGDKLPFFERDRFIVGGAIHELGHTLGLTVDDHGGNDNTIATMPFSKQWFLYLPYRSCMNYWYTYKILTFSDGALGPTDFNDWKHMDLSFFKDTHFTLPNSYL